MDFKLWLQMCDYEHMTKEQIAEAAWTASACVEREACAELCRKAGDTFLAQERFMPLERKADAGQVAGACEFAIRMRSNV